MIRNGYLQKEYQEDKKKKGLNSELSDKEAVGLVNVFNKLLGINCQSDFVQHMCWQKRIGMEVRVEKIMVKRKAAES